MRTPCPCLGSEELRSCKSKVNGKARKRSSTQSLTRNKKPKFLFLKLSINKAVFIYLIFFFFTDDHVAYSHPLIKKESIYVCTLDSSFHHQLAYFTLVSDMRNAKKNLASGYYFFHLLLKALEIKYFPTIQDMSPPSRLQASQKLTLPQNFPAHPAGRYCLSYNK